ncbi:glutathione S-transferase T2-like [Primulina tabacum]|uniref:glutathione S-transferase T2-like n=1 Tax=Primulina tabacum TaxID=48773 RepID=UPI003F5AD265
MASNARTASYNVEEDMIICHVYLDITQNPIIGINQSKDQFWTRVEEAYNITKPNSLQVRNKRSLQCRMKVVLRHIGRLRGCIRQIETLKPSGASEEDIFNRAKDLFMQDSNYSKGFKFDHVWPIMKDIEKFSSDINPSSSVSKIHVTNLDSSQSEAQTPENPISGSPAFSINLSSDENAGDTSSERPIGVKKAKLKKKKDDNISELLSTMKQGHHNLMNILEKGSTELHQHYDIQMLKLQNDKLKLENQQKKIETRQQEMAFSIC